MKLTNKDICDNYQDTEFYLTRKDFLGAFAYWIVYQSPYDSPNITQALNAFKTYIDVFLFKGEVVVAITQKELNTRISEDVFESIPEIEIFNHPEIDTGSTIMVTSRHFYPKPDYDFIDLGALAHNIKFMLMRERITSGTTVY